MYHLVETLRIVAILIKPAMEDTSCKIFKQLGIPENMQEYNTIYNFGKELKNIKVIEKRWATILKTWPRRRNKLHKRTNAKQNKK